MRIFSLVCCAGLVLGCSTEPRSKYDKVDLVNAGGRITLDGNPLSGAVVTFEDPNDETFSYAMTDSNGNYSLQFDSVMRGVKTGRKLVRISTTRKLLGLTSAPGNEGDDDPDAKPRNQELVPEQFNKKSTLTCVVSAGETEFNFDLKSNG